VKEGAREHFLSFLYKTVKDTLFPVFCFGCKTEGEWVCEACFGKLDVSGVFDCPVCHASTVAGVSCVSCRDVSNIRSQISIMKYEERGLVGKMIHALKYFHAEDVKEIFDKIISQFMRENRDLLAHIDVVAPVPLHRRRYAERGFNQATLIARTVAREFDVPLDECVKRVRYTKQQVKLSKQGRVKNVADAFVCKKDMSGKHVLLVDDVFTTGSTVQSCAEVILDVGASEVHGFSVARG